MENGVLRLSQEAKEVHLQGGTLTDEQYESDVSGSVASTAGLLETREKREGREGGDDGSSVELYWAEASPARAAKPASL